MCEQEVKIELSDEIEKIMMENLDEKGETEIIKLESCENCRFYDNAWVWGGKLHCCSANHESGKDPVTSRDCNKLFDNCPQNQEMEITKSFIKRYGIIHKKPNREYGYESGSISIVDFKGTRFEDDGYNPDVYWEAIVVFYYNNQEEADRMMKLAYQYYTEFNLGEEWIEKVCYG